MRAPIVTVVDYGIGNLYSVERAFDAVGARVVFASDASAIESSERLVLPGVGAFADGMGGLRERGLVEALQRFGRSGRPMLGICLGMQMMATVSEEFGEHSGLDLIPGRVVALRAATSGGPRLKVPRVGWGALEAPTADAWASTPLSDVPAGACVYLVHSFEVQTADAAHVIGFSPYGDRAVATVIRSGPVFGFQFHPEKSGREGLRMLQKFAQLRAP